VLSESNLEESQINSGLTEAKSMRKMQQRAQISVEEDDSENNI
jgi:hypothetical protein